MNYKKCSWKFKSGKRKGECCNKPGFDTDHGELCVQHWKQNCKLNNNNNNNNNIEWNEELENFSKNHTVQQLRALLKEKKLKVSGKKRDLIIRLKTNK